MGSARFICAAALFTAFVVQGRASILVAMGGSDAAERTTASVQVSAAQQPAVAFVLPAQEYRVDSVTLALRDYSSASDRPVIGFYTDDHGRPGTMLGSPLKNPLSSSNRAANFTFIPSDSLLLKPGGTYWVMASSAFGSFAWSSSDLLTSRSPFGEASFHSYKVGLNFGEIFIEDNPIPSFVISATAVPEPGVLSILALALGRLLLWRRRKAA